VARIDESASPPISTLGYATASGDQTAVFPSSQAPQEFVISFRAQRLNALLAQYVDDIVRRSRLAVAFRALNE
jgi:hypothetical protein